MGSFIAVFWAMTLPWVQGSSSQCKSQGLSLLAHRSGRKSRYCPMHFECMWWNSPYLLQSNSTTDVESNTNTALGDISCATGGCGDQLPKGPEACMDFFGGCTPPFQGGNCFYANAQMKTLDGEDCAGCGYYVCHCKNLSQDRCTEESLGWDYTLLSRSTLFMEKSWELVGGEGNHACRGDNSTDNRATLYTVYNKIYSLYGCKKMCEKRWPTACHGIEYSYGRCEIWVRHGGLFAYQEIPREKGNYTCMRYGWPTSKLVPLDPSGETLHPCRASGGRNHPSFYTLAHKATPTSYRDIEECKAACSNAWFCTGIEWSLGRCEIWTVLIESFERNVNGYHCLRMIP